MIGLIALAVGLHGDPIVMLRSRIVVVTSNLRGVNASLGADSSLTVSYQAHLVTHRSVDKTGRMGKGSFTALEPRDSGFVVSAYSFDHKRTDPPRAFQQVPLPGSHMDAADYQVDGTDKAIYFHLQWGSKVDPSLVQRLKDVVAVGARRL